jgi:hypothetical protein
LSEGIAVGLEQRAVALVPARAGVIAEGIAAGLLERDAAGARLRFTRRGMMLANETLPRLI